MTRLDDAVTMLVAAARIEALEEAIGARDNIIVVLMDRLGINEIVVTEAEHDRALTRRGWTSIHFHGGGNEPLTCELRTTPPHAETPAWGRSASPGDRLDA